MFIEKVKNNGTEYLRLVEGVRVDGKNGKTIRKKIICNIGPLSRFDDGKPDYIQRLKTSFVNGDPLIDSLKPYCISNKSFTEYRFKITEGSDECIGEPKLYAHSLVEQIIGELGIMNVISSYKTNYRFKYDVAGFIRLLIYGRVLEPASKLSTVNQNNDYYNPVISGDVYKYNIYDTLDFISKHKKQLINRINHSLIKNGQRNTEYIYYDVTNFFFETELADEDITNESGEVIEKGLRKIGVSKENRRQPIVQMGLFMDSNGYPISIEIFPGNTLDHLTVQKALSKNIDDLIESRYIFVGDRGVCNYANLCHLIEGNKGFIMSKSISKSTNEEKGWITSEKDYHNKGTEFKHKSRIVTKTVVNERNEKTKITFKEVAYFSKKFYEKQMHENKTFLEFLKKLEESPNSFRITTSESRLIKSFLKKEVENKDTGEIIDSSKLKLLIDYEKVNAYKSFFGYYLLISSEIHKDDLEVIEIYHRLTQIENQFRIMKSSLETRPIYVNVKEHIEAHLIICMIALLVIRIIQNKILLKKLANKKEKSSAQFEMGLSAERIKKALKSWTVEKLADEYYRFNNLNNNDLKTILTAFDIEVPLKLYTKQELRSLKKKINIFC